MFRDWSTMSTMSTTSETIIDDDVMDKVIAQLTEDSAYITSALSTYSDQRIKAIEAQKLAIATYYAEINEIEREYSGELDEERVISEAQVDHNVLRYLNIERGSDEAKKLETFAPKKPNELTETMLKNIDELKFIGSSAEHHPPPSEGQKTKIRERMFDFLDESRMEETRLELEYDKAEEENDTKRMEEIKEAIYYMQRLHADKLGEMIAEYRPNGQPNQWGNDPEYMAMIENIKRVNAGSGKHSSGGKRRSAAGSRKKKNIEAAKKAAENMPTVSYDEFDASRATTAATNDEVEINETKEVYDDARDDVVGAEPPVDATAAPVEADTAVEEDEYSDGNEFEDDFEDL